MYTYQELCAMSPEQRRAIFKKDLLIALTEQILCTDHKDPIQRESVAAQGIGRLLDYLCVTGDYDIARRVRAMMSGYFPKAMRADGSVYVDERGPMWMHDAKFDGTEDADWD